MSLLGIITRTLLGLAPSPAATSGSPLHAAPTAPAATASAGTPAPATASTGTPAPATTSAGAHAPASAAEVVDRVQQFYAGIKQVSAQFRQAVTNDTFGSTKTSDGSVWIMKPGKMRWDYLEKRKNDAVVKKSFISNGTSLYVVEHDNKQVVKKNLQQDLMPVAVSFLYGKGDLKTEFTPELDKSGKYGEKDSLVLKLTPRQPSAQYKNLYLVVSPADFHVSQSVIVDSSNNVNHFRFFAPDFKTPIKESSFEFDERSVKNYRVIDPDAQKDGASPPPALPSAKVIPVPPPTPKK